ncbi:hypothetical protein B0T18DRAFT_447093 [Schizothecium vesticola]|uniref:Peptide hydrolase n=1 Tax=Schizothecium vesticola TaxID=314040 RepID=A0AA40EVZ8_9PEZI|nr:hypothetical protein B0T18DRAFT_447093 [Schizothecium vesticola]
MRFLNFVPLALCVHDVLAAGPPVFFFTKFPTSTTALRDELITRMDNISRWSCTNEPGVTKYALVIPRGGGDNLTAYSIEQYDDDPTFLSHLSAPLVSTSLFSWSTSTPNLWTSDPLVQNFTLLPNDMTFSKPEFAKASNPYIVVESLTYTSGGVHHVMDHWEEEVAAARNETGTLLFGVYGDPTNNNRLWTLAAYESEQYWREVHEKSETARELRFAWWAAEELVGLGSRFYCYNLTDNFPAEVDKILAYLNFDMVSQGTYYVSDGDGSTGRGWRTQPSADVIEKLWLDYFAGIGIAAKERAIGFDSDHFFFQEILKKSVGFLSRAWMLRRILAIIRRVTISIM